MRWATLTNNGCISPVCIGPLVPPTAPQPACIVNKPTARFTQVVASKMPWMAANTPAEHVTQVTGCPCESPQMSTDAPALEVQDDVLTLDTCGHSFHFKCLSSWFLIERHDCPVCRVPYYKGAGLGRDRIPIVTFF